MAYEARLIGTLNDRRRVYQVAAPLDEQLIAFRKVGIERLAAPDEVARIRLEDISKDSTRTSMGVIAMQNRPTILVRDSPLTRFGKDEPYPLMADAAVEANRNGKYFETSGEVYEAAEALAKKQEGLNPEDRDVIIISFDGRFSLTPEMPESRFILKGQTQEYFDRFTKGKMLFWNIFASRGVARINYLRFYNPATGDSSLQCREGDLCSHSEAFGVLPVSDKK